LGVVTTIVGVAAPVSAGNFPGPLPASIVSPYGVAIDPSTGKLYITLPDAVMVAVLPK
jgi:DNA-binding beta-propeller fold protein YncE